MYPKMRHGFVGENAAHGITASNALARQRFEADDSNSNSERVCSENR